MALRFGVRIRDRAALRALDRVRAQTPLAVERGMLKFGFLLGRRIAENIEAFKQTVGTRRLSRSFATPAMEAVAGGASIVLGRSAPIYAAIHEFGGTIRPVKGEYLVFQTPDGAWHSVKEVTIREKRYARDALEDAALQATAGRMIATSIASEFKA